MKDVVLGRRTRLAVSERRRGREFGSTRETEVFRFINETKAMDSDDKLFVGHDHHTGIDRFYSLPIHTQILRCVEFRRARSGVVEINIEMIK